MSHDFAATTQKWKDPETRRKIGVGAFLALIIAGVYAGVNEVFPEQNGHYGIWSIMPPLVAIVLAFYTREVVSSLFIGIALGGGNFRADQYCSGLPDSLSRYRKFCAHHHCLSMGSRRIDRYLDEDRWGRKVCYLGQ